jgi:hypothetical protein
MASRLTVIFFIVLCLEAGIFLTVLPWWQPWGMGDWGDNYFLVVVAHKAGFVGLQRAVASGWVRGAVTGLGLLNLAMAFWETLHFRETVRRLQSSDREQPPSAQKMSAPATSDASDAARTSEADNLSHHERRDDRLNDL